MKFVAMMEMERNHLARETMVQDEGCKGPPPLRGGPSDKLPTRGVERRRFISYEICLSSLLSRI